MRNEGQTEVHQDLGTLIDIGNVMYPEANDYIRTHPEREEVSELAEPEFGWIAPLDETTRELLELPKSAAALVEWNNGADEDPETEIRWLNAAERVTITSRSTSTLVEQVLAHYDAHPGDDGHPAFGLYAEWQRRKTRAAELAK